MTVSRETGGGAQSLEKVDVPRETMDRLNIFVELLLRWNRTINLISRRDEPDIWARHVSDSLQLLPLLPEGLPRAIDLGSGAGFPGLVLSIATNVPFDLIEADQRKAAFLREAARETGALALVHASRIEAAQVIPAQLVTARALAPLSTLVELAVPFLAKDGICLFPKGRETEAELTEAARGWTMRVDRFTSRVDRSGVILRISEVARV